MKQSRTAGEGGQASARVGNNMICCLTARICGTRTGPVTVEPWSGRWGERGKKKGKYGRAKAHLDVCTTHIHSKHDTRSQPIAPSHLLLPPPPAPAP